MRSHFVFMMKQSVLKYLSFGTLAVVTVILIAATIIEKIYGSEFVSDYIYGNPIIVALWGIVAMASLIYLLKCHVHKQVVTFALHISFVLILVGAFLSYLYGEQGAVHLRTDSQPSDTFVLRGGEMQKFPFTVRLNEFNQKYYQGTFAPMDYESRIVIAEHNGDTVTGVVSMNNIYSYKGYRFYQSGFDKDGKGTILAVSHDVAGIAVTYSGYVLLLLSMIMFFFQKDSAFRRLLKHGSLKKSVFALGLVLLSPVCAFAKQQPTVLPSDVADRFGDIYVYYNDRVCPMETLAKDFTVKLCGKATYKGLSANQVLTGWFFYYDDWKNESMIKIKGADVREILGITENAKLSDFIDISGYKLENALQSASELSLRQNIESANEKFNLISMITTGSLLKIYPYKSNGEETARWYSLADRLPTDMPADQWAFVRNSMSYVAERVAMKDYESVCDLLVKIKKFQQKSAGADGVPTESQFKAEQLYNVVGSSRLPAMICVTIGIILFFVYCRYLSLGKKCSSRLNTIFTILLLMIFLYLTFVILLRGFVSGHVPLSNGYETMQFMAWCSVLITLILRSRYAMSLPFGFLLCGLTLMVAMMGESNPAITQLMPVLQSPLLSIHVVVIMLAYSLLAFIMLNGITALILHWAKTDNPRPIEYLQLMSRIMLYPAVFLLAAGIFIGAVWANISWGRYWGWDPKEVWALITMIVYAFAIHVSSLPKFQKPMFFHVFCIIAFLTVIITYFGVNFFLGGLHSYA